MSGEVMVGHFDNSSGESEVALTLLCRTKGKSTSPEHNHSLAPWGITSAWTSMFDVLVEWLVVLSEGWG